MIYKQCENIITLILFLIFHPRMMFYDDQMHMSASLLSQVQFFSIDRNGQGKPAIQNVNCLLIV